MSIHEDFAPLVDALVTIVGIIDVVSLFGFIINRKSAKEQRKDLNNNEIRALPHVLIDGVAPLKFSDDVIDSLVSKVNELEAKVVDLDRKSRESSMERFVEVERYRRSHTPSPQAVASFQIDESSSNDDENNTSSTESRASSVRQPSKNITRDDTFRQTKRSHVAHDSRQEELMDFTQLEKEEAENMDDFVPILYEGHDNPNRSRLDVTDRHISPIIERSPEPGMSSMVDKPWCDIKKDAADIRKLEKRDQVRRSLSIDEQPNEEKAAEDLLKKNSLMKSVDVNESFIKIEQNMLQQSSKMLVKQDHVLSEDQPDEAPQEPETPSTPFIEIMTDPFTEKSTFSNEVETIFPTSITKEESEELKDETEKNQSAITLESTPSVVETKLNDAFEIESSAVVDPSNISGSPSSGDGLKRSKRFLDSLDRSASRSSSRLSRSKKSKTPSVASEEDYKEWFDKFDNHINPNLTVPENDDDDDFDSDIEELLLNIDDGSFNGTEICKIEEDESRDVSVSVTLSLKKSPVDNQETKSNKTKPEDFLEQERFRENQTRRLSIVPFTQEQQENFVSDLHPEEFSQKSQQHRSQHRSHHDHMRNVGYSEWMKKVVDHHSSHLALSDSDSDSDVPLDESRMLPRFEENHGK